jgi:F420-non-reducing hydrogenase small subunit
MAKPKVAFYWCASCGGCEEAVVDLNENILPVAAAVDIVLWPVALDFKRKDVENLKDGEIAVSFINGAVRLSEHVMMVKLLRRKSQLVVSFGACSHLGGIPGLANFWNEDLIFERIYKTVPTIENPDNTLPMTEVEVKGGKIDLPHFFSTVRTLDQTIPVDYYLPGCPPPTDLIGKTFQAILKGELPEKGSVLAPEKSLCDTCPRAENKPEKISITKIRRPHEIIPDPKKCFLEEGIICLGPATRSGCGATCINANMPCRGCMGPTKRVSDHGAKMMSAIASILGIEDEEELEEDEVKKIIDQIVDPAGTFYRFSLPASILRRKKI